MTASQFAEWYAFYQIEPFGEERADLRSGIISATLANVYRSEGKPYLPLDFMPFRKRETPENRAENNTAQIKAMLLNASLQAKEINIQRKQDG